MKKYVKVLTLLGAMLFSHITFAQQYSRYTNVVNNPTAFTLGSGTYQLGVHAYAGGGTELKTVVGLTDILMIGVSFDIENAIGQGDVTFHIPGVIAKLRITDGPESFPISLAIGYDSYYMGKTSTTQTTTESDSSWDSSASSTTTGFYTHHRMTYGPYIAVTKPIYLFDNEQHISFGVRTPMQPSIEPDDTSYFLSLNVPLGDYFAVKGEMERLYWNFDRLDQVLWNVGVRYNIFTKVGLEFDMMIENDHGINRTVRIEYSDEF